MRTGDLAAWTGILLGAATSVALTVGLAVERGESGRAAEPRPASPAHRPGAVPRAPIHGRPDRHMAPGFRPPIDFAVIRVPHTRMSGPESAATGWHRPPVNAPPLPDSR